ncbi:extracellular solute-binding protein [Arthrobacter sp.]|uniref:ABC transporter substrate-binding protein n=1 Tax=Arthrobacter sp. TaxID=1667 RepID=UPI00339768C1
MLSACGGGGDANADTEGSSGFTLMFSSPSAATSPYELLADAYMKEHPDVTITLNRQPIDTYDTTLRTQLQAGNASDLVQTAPGSGLARSVIALAEEGFLAPLNESSAALVPEDVKDQFQIDGETFGQPLDYTVFSLITNDTAAKELGLNEFPTDFDEYLAACKTSAEQGKYMLALQGLAGPSAGYTSLVIAATRVYAETPDWDAQRAAGDVTFADSEGWHDTLQTFIDLDKNGCFQEGAEGAGAGVSANLISSGQAVNYTAPGVVSVEILEAAPKGTELSVRAFPPAAGEKPTVLASSNFSLSVTAESKNQPAAQAFLDWLKEPAQAELYEEVTGTLHVSARENLDLSGGRHAPVAELLESGSTASLPINNWPNAQVFDELVTGAQGLLTGQRTIDQVLAAMDAAWTK